MDLGTRVVGALIATYFARLLVLRTLGSSGRRAGPMVVANVVGFALCGGAVGLIKTALTAFNPDAAMLYLVPQIIWLTFDLWRIGTFTARS